MDWKEDLIRKSKLYGEYYTLELKDYFNYDKCELNINDINEQLDNLTDIELLELEKFPQILGHGKSQSSLYNKISPKGTLCAFESIFSNSLSLIKVCWLVKSNLGLPSCDNRLILFETILVTVPFLTTLELAGDILTSFLFNIL